MKPIKVIKAIVLLSFPMCLGATTLIAVQDTVPEKYVKVEEGPPPPPAPEKYLVIEKQPEFPGGQSALLQFLSSNIKYPAEARNKNIKGKSVAQFIVNEDGSISDINVVRKIGGGCDEEVMRVVQLMPKWSPGIIAGKPSKVRFTLPVSFHLP